jgi:cytochrome P450
MQMAQAISHTLNYSADLLNQYETLRLFAPVVHLARGCLTPQTITTSKGTYHFPANTKVFINNTAIACDPSVWGEDANEFKPTRWLSKDAETGETVMLPPPRGSFMPWSLGPRSCPGQKMSQVEFTAVFTKLFRSCRVEPTLRPGESLEEARQRLYQLTQKSEPRLTLQINNPEDLELTWTKR